MGCDIHYAIETRAESGRWELYGWDEKYIIGNWEDDVPKYDYTAKRRDPLDISRNYVLFAILAGVRNSFGTFHNAGEETSTALAPIAEPRGIPDDATIEIRKRSDGYGPGGHSHSWLLLSEMLDYDYDKVVPEYGMVDVAEYRRMTNQVEASPSSWCRGTSGIVVHEEVMKAVVAGIVDPSKGHAWLYTKLRWERPIRDRLGQWWFTFMSTLEQMFGRDNVRLVFFFDN